LSFLLRIYFGVRVIFFSPSIFYCHIPPLQEAVTTIATMRSSTTWSQMDDRSNGRMQFSHPSGGLRYDPHGPQQQQRYNYDRRDTRGDRRYGPPQQQHFDQRHHYGPQQQQQRYDQHNRYGPPQQQRYDQFNHYRPPQQQQRYDQHNHYGPQQQQQRYDQRNPHHNVHGYSCGNYDISMLHSRESSYGHGPHKQSRPLSNRSNDRGEHSGQHRLQKYPLGVCKGRPS
jgi:hypothetical protein